MPRLHGYKQKHHQPYWDSLIRTVGNPSPAIAATTNLFGNSNVGTLSLTNLDVAGQFASDQTFVILALRVYLHFTNTHRQLLYRGVASQLYWTLKVGDKPQFQAPTWYLPAGGGVWGYDSATSVFANGVPAQTSILKLAKPIMVPVRQAFKATAEFYVTGSSDVRNGATSLNSGTTDEEKIIMFMIDGIHTRDVE